MSKSFHEVSGENKGHDARRKCSKRPPFRKIKRILLTFGENLIYCISDWRDLNNAQRNMRFIHPADT